MLVCAARQFGLIVLIAGVLAAAQDGPGRDDAIGELSRQAEAIAPLVTSAATQEMLGRVPHLPMIDARTIWFRRNPRAALSDAEYQALKESERAGFELMEFDTRRYYETFYGTPLAVLRAFDLAARSAEWQDFAGRRVLDIGYGSIGQLRLLAESGGDAVGLEVEPLLHALYSFPEDTGPVLVDGVEQGAIKLVLGLWPRDVAEEIGGGYDLIISKNTLKKGYVAPEEPDPRGLGVNLSVPPVEYVRALADALKPGGLMMIYNIGPAPGPDGRGDGESGAETYVHMADIRCPFPREMWEEAGFEIIAFDEDDSATIWQFAAAFGWNESGEGAIDVARNFYAMYTLLRKGGGDDAPPRPDQQS